MWDYTEKVIDLFHNPHNMGAIEPHECRNNETIAIGDVGSIACGDALRLHLKINNQTEKILDARFQTFGCASAIASSSALTDLVQGMTVDEALTITNREIADFLGGLPQEKMHCSVMGQEALEAAIANYRGQPVRVDDDDDSPLVCTCFAVSEGRIKRVIRDNALTTAEEVTNYIKAGGGCGSCLADIDDLLAEVASERDQVELALETCLSLTPEPAPTPTVPVDSQPRLTTVQKISLIQQVLEAEIRPFLMADGGDVELYDVDGDRVQVILKGACGSCPSSLATLKLGIEETLRDRLEPGLLSTIPHCQVNGHPALRLPNTTNIGFKYIEGEAILLSLDRYGICASSGSACTSDSLEPSHVLRAMGLPYSILHGSVRFSLSRYTTDAEVDRVLAVMPPIVEKLRAISPFKGEEDETQGWLKTVSSEQLPVTQEKGQKQLVADR